MLIEHLQQILYENGISYYGYNIVEYWDGFGSVLIALDVLSEEQYYDIIQNIESVKKEGVKYHYCMVQHIYVNIDVILKITGDDMYTEYQLDEVEQHTFTAVQLYFNNNMGVGNGLSKNRLSAYILQYLVQIQLLI